MRLFLSLWTLHTVAAFVETVPLRWGTAYHPEPTELFSSSSEDDNPKAKKKDNSAMAFLKKIGKVGGAANKNFVNAVGSDEGTTGRQPPADRMSTLKKQRGAYQECTVSGVIDDLSQDFPLTSSGTEWRGVSDRVMGGVSNGSIQRENDLQGKRANVLKGHVSLENNGGFIQMVTDLALDPSKTIAVDASDYDGLELDVLSRGQSEFNIHIRTPGTFQQASYRHTHKIEQENEWETVRVPFSSFKGYGQDDMPPTLDSSALRRIGLVAIGQEMDVFLAVAGIRFYKVI